MDGTHGRTTSEDDPEQQLLRRAVQGRLAQGGASWEQNSNARNVPTIRFAGDSDPVGNGIFQTTCLEKEKLQHKSTR
mgnify:CR=1 FL=1